MEYETPKREKADTEIHDVVSSFSLFVCIVLSQSEFYGFSLVVFVLFGCACVRVCVCVPCSVHFLFYVFQFWCFARWLFLFFNPKTSHPIDFPMNVRPRKP